VKRFKVELTLTITTNFVGLELLKRGLRTRAKRGVFKLVLSETLTRLVGGSKASSLWVQGGRLRFLDDGDDGDGQTVRGLSNGAPGASRGHQGVL
jgi:hypothetical protein